MKPLFRPKHTELAATKVTNSITVQAIGVPPIITKATFFIEKSADLMVTQTTNKSTVYVGENLTYTIVVTNNGPSNATGVVLTSILPIEVTFVSIVVNQGTYEHTGNLITCNLGDITRGSSTIITITIVSNMPGVIKNFTRVSGKEYDPDISNNIFTETSTVYPPQPRYRGFDFF